MRRRSSRPSRSEESSPRGTAREFFTTSPMAAGSGAYPRTRNHTDAERMSSDAAPSDDAITPALMAMSESASAQRTPRHPFSSNGGQHARSGQCRRVGMSPQRRPEKIRVVAHARVARCTAYESMALMPRCAMPAANASSIPCGHCADDFTAKAMSSSLPTSASARICSRAAVASVSVAKASRTGPSNGDNPRTAMTLAAVARTSGTEDRSASVNDVVSAPVSVSCTRFPTETGVASCARAVNAMKQTTSRDERMTGKICRWFFGRAFGIRARHSSRNLAETENRRRDHRRQPALGF
jgi:hypothetical protein